MRRIYITCIVNVAAIAFLANLFATDGTATVSDYLLYAGSLSLMCSGICIGLGLILLMFRQKRWGHGFLLTGCILLLLGVLEYAFPSLG
jgi:ABC-type Fe3+ transport system permease subunit